MESAIEGSPGRSPEECDWISPKIMRPRAYSDGASGITYSLSPEHIAVSQNKLPVIKLRFKVQKDFCSIQPNQILME